MMMFKECIFIENLLAKETVIVQKLPYLLFTIPGACSSIFVNIFSCQRFLSQIRKIHTLISFLFVCSNNDASIGTEIAMKRLSVATSSGRDFLHFTIHQIQFNISIS